MSNFLNTAFDLENPEFISTIDELPLWSAPFGINLLNKIIYRKNITVLDIGSGLGFPLLEVAMRLGNTCKLYGIDPWGKAVERARIKLKHYQISNVEIIEGVAENIPLPDNSIDLIISNNGINNVDDINQTLKECKRISRPNARFVFTFNTDKTMVEFYSALESVLIDMNLPSAIEKMKKHIYEKRRPVEEIVNLLSQYGFIVDEIDHDEFHYTYVDGTTMFNHFLIRLAFIDSWKKIIPEQLHSEIFSEIEKRLNAVAMERGSLKLTVPFVLINAEKHENK
ncbi:MAG: class I SAM-dependent methyltransferase [Ignavibacteriaceae bacterium]